MNFINKTAGKLASSLIWVYQRTLSPDYGLFKSLYPHGYCKFYPSCSEYSRQSFVKYGLFKGFILSSNRVVKCHPWASPKVDLVP